jgi:hypothetical protein
MTNVLFLITILLFIGSAITTSASLQVALFLGGIIFVWVTWASLRNDKAKQLKRKMEEIDGNVSRTV